VPALAVRAAPAACRASCISFSLAAASSLSPRHRPRPQVFMFRLAAITRRPVLCAFEPAPRCSVMPQCGASVRRATKDGEQNVGRAHRLWRGKDWRRANWCAVRTRPQGGDGGGIEGGHFIELCETPSRQLAILPSAAARLSAATGELSPRPEQRSVLAVNRIVARPRRFRDRGERLFSVLQRGASSYVPVGGQAPTTRRSSLALRHL
jgi:hypothetical protein